MPQPCNGLAPEEMSDILRVRPQGALCKWAQRFLAQGVTGLADKPGRGSERLPHPAPPREQHDLGVG